MQAITVGYAVFTSVYPLAKVFYILNNDGGYTLFSMADNLFITCNIDASDTTSISNFVNSHKATSIIVTCLDDAYLLGTIANTNTLVAPYTSDGRIRTVSEKSNASTMTFYSHDWCDKTTWYEKSIKITENAINSGDNLTYTLAHSFVIDNYHGKLTNEDFLKDTDGYSYRVSIKVDGITKTEQDPHYGSGGNFIINYITGSITFLTALDPSSIVSVIYHYATTSQFTVKPLAGKQLRISNVEVQFSDDVISTDTIIFQPYGFVEVFAPQYCTVNGGPYPVGTKIPLGNPVIYKSMQDLLNDSKKSYPTYPALGGDNWRGIARPSIIMDWEYEGEKILRSDYGMEIRVFLQHDCVFGGAFSTATFYSKSENIS